MTGRILAIAEKELAVGNHLAAVTLVEDAARADDVDAIMQLAVWHLLGTPLRRDLVAARALLKRAVAIGHVDGALMEIALTANGSGGSIDWPAASHLLRIAAKSDYVAAGQLALLDRMNLGDDGFPNKPAQLEELSRLPNVWRIDRFLTPDECRHIADTAAPLLEPATVIDPSTKMAVANPIRTSDGAAIGPTREDLVVRAVNHRIAAASETPVENGEPLTILRYGIGQQYRPHVDTLPAARNQRVRTMLIYLNQGYGGGATQFLANGLTVRCNAGDAILFDNVLPDGTPDMSSRHAGQPVTSGSKWIATRWIRATRHDPWAAH
ncbi:2OG-Fe(II) oxygenase [Sphingomonas sp. GB1N7]|uniref:2OG-Fe(II) oxygenase n=1 Tax=Parasphingomonas caseinilytica TaxID=3096158 RepID=UPI002FCC8AB4